MLCDSYISVYTLAPNIALFWCFFWIIEFDFFSRHKERWQRRKVAFSRQETRKKTGVAFGLNSMQNSATNEEVDSLFISENWWSFYTTYWVVYLSRSASPGQPSISLQNPNIFSTREEFFRPAHKSYSVVHPPLQTIYICDRLPYIPYIK